MTEYNSGLVKRTVKYWLAMAEKQFIIFALIAVGYFLYGYFLSANMDHEQLLAGLSGSFIGMGLLALFSYAVSTTQIYMPLTISFGSTRKQAFIGYQAGSWILIIQILLAGKIASLLAGKSNVLLDTNVLLYFGILLFVLGIGQIFAIFIARFGSKGTVVLFAIVGGIAGFTSFFVLVFGFSYINWLSSKMVILTGVLTGGLVSYILGTGLNYRSTLKLSVKW